MGAADRQLLVAREGAGLQRHPVLGHAERPREAAHHAGLHRPDPAGHHPGHRRRRQPDPGRADPARGSRLHQHRVHGVGARQELQQHLLHAVLDRRDRRGVPLVGGEPEPAAQGRDRDELLQGRRPAQAQGGLHAAGELPVLLGLLPADVLEQPRQAHQHRRHDPADHPRRGRARLLHRLQVSRRAWRSRTTRARPSSRTTPTSCCSSSTTTRSSTPRTSTTRSA